MDNEKIKEELIKIKHAAEYLGCIGSDASHTAERLAQIIGIISTADTLIKEIEENGK